MRFILNSLFLFSFWVLPALAADSPSTLPPVTSPYDVNATIPGEGYQGWAGPYGGEKILQYCYFNRFLGEPKASKTMYFEFGACSPTNKKMTAVITWGDNTQQTIERVICGHWRIPHTYQNPGTYSANIVIEGETCAPGCQEPVPPKSVCTEPPTKLPPFGPCTFWAPDSHGRCDFFDTDKKIICSAIPGPFNDCYKTRQTIKLNDKVIYDYEGLSKDAPTLSFTPFSHDVLASPNTTLTDTLMYPNGLSTTINCQWKAPVDDIRPIDVENLRKSNEKNESFSGSSIKPTLNDSTTPTAKIRLELGGVVGGLEGEVIKEHEGITQYNVKAYLEETPDDLTICGINGSNEIAPQPGVHVLNFRQEQGSTHTYTYTCWHWVGEQLSAFSSSEKLTTFSSASASITTPGPPDKCATPVGAAQTPTASTTDNGKVSMLLHSDIPSPLPSLAIASQSKDQKISNDSNAYSATASSALGGYVVVGGGLAAIIGALLVLRRLLIK